jgi:shikimate dehydrogenase
LGLIADPVEQARSPVMMNSILQDRGQLGSFVLVPMHVPDEALGQVTTALRSIQNFAGAIVSMPHKSSIAAMLDELTADARMVGAVNVIRRNNDGRLLGTMLDGEGFVSGLRAAGHEIKSASCLLVGAGGAGAAIAFSLAKHGCASLTINNRTASRAMSLAARVRQAFPAIPVQSADSDFGSYDVLINATSLGMKTDDELPVSQDVVERCALVAECVLAPEMTRLVQLAQAKGRAIQTGVPMLAAQMDLMLRFMGVE